MTGLFKVVPYTHTRDRIVWAAKTKQLKVRYHQTDKGWL